jgi:hypothetical protein
MSKLGQSLASTMVRPLPVCPPVNGLNQIAPACRKRPNPEAAGRWTAPGAPKSEIQFSCVGGLLTYISFTPRNQVRLRMVEASGPSVHKRLRGRAGPVGATNGSQRPMLRPDGGSNKKGLGTIAPLRNIATYQPRHTLVLFSLHAAGRAETRRSLRKSGNTIWRCRSPRNSMPISFQSHFSIKVGIWENEDSSIAPQV